MSDTDQGKTKAGAKGTKNITVDADLVDVLNDCADKLEVKFGFRPTLSQTLRHLVKKGMD